MRKFTIPVLLALVTLFVVQSCSKSGNNGTPATSDQSFDRKAMLSNISSTIIVPAYVAFQSATANLDAAVTAFNSAPDLAKLGTAQAAFVTAYKQWQNTGTFEFGPAATVGLRVNTNTYPADVNQINANVTAGSYNPAILANLPAKGLPALDYLLFGVGADNTAILAQYSTDASSAKRRTYLAAISAELKTNAATVAAAWTGAYPSTFNSSAGTDAGSSTALLVNQFVFDYEILKNFEIGIPAGTQSMGTVLPTKVQGYYSKISAQLAIAHISSLSYLYLGKSAQGDGAGLDDYLIKLNAQKNGASLDATIKAKFTAATAKLQTLSDPLADQIRTNTSAVTGTYTELQKLTVLLKTDMTSALAILISYGDNDGD